MDVQPPHTAIVVSSNPARQAIVATSISNPVSKNNHNPYQRFPSERSPPECPLCPNLHIARLSKNPRQPHLHPWYAPKPSSLHTPRCEGLQRKVGTKLPPSSGKRQGRQASIIHRGPCVHSHEGYLVFRASSSKAYTAQNGFTRFNSSARVPCCCWRNASSLTYLTPTLHLMYSAIGGTTHLHASLALYSADAGHIQYWVLRCFASRETVDVR